MRSAIARDTFEEWNEILARHGSPEGAITEEKLVMVLKELRQNSADLAFKRFGVGEAVGFLLMTFPRTLCYQLGKTESKFLMSFAESWRPSVDKWVATLYRYCGEAYNFFGMVLSANRKILGYTHTKLGHSFLSVLTRFSCGPYAISGAVGWILRHPKEKVLVRVHEQDLYELTRRMNPEQVGFIVRCWLIFRSKPKKCRCGWMPMDKHCKCPQLDVEFDPLKEYCFPLFHTVCKRRSGAFDEYDRENRRMPSDDGHGPQINNWNNKDATTFCATASEDFLTANSYEEICTNMSLTEFQVEPVLKKTRKLTDKETRVNFGESYSQHSGCIHKGCKVIPNFGCPNFACSPHCREIGYLKCHPHRHQGYKMPETKLKCPIAKVRLMEMARKGGHLGNKTA